MAGKPHLWASWFIDALENGARLKASEANSQAISTNQNFKWVWIIFSVAFIALAFFGGAWKLALVPAVAGLALAFFSLNRKKEKSKHTYINQKVTPNKGIAILPSQIADPETEERRNDTTRAFLKGDLSLVGNEAKAKEARRVAVQELEDSIDAAIFDGLVLLKQGLTGGHTYGVLFPGKSEGLYLRAWITDSDSLIPGATINSNQGLVGQLYKEGVQRVIEGDIAEDSTLLHYYSLRNEGIRSLIGVPIVVKGARRGAIFVDSLRGNAFTSKDLEPLESLANLVGLLAYQSYMGLEHNYHNEQLAALTNYQRKFLENMSVENIIMHVQNYMTECLEGDRFLVIERTAHNGDRAKIVCCIGPDSENLEGLQFFLSENALVSLVFEKDQVINRVFPGAPYVPRFTQHEKISTRMASLIAVPVPTDEGVDMALVVESKKSRRFSEHHQNLLTTIARAAGFALSRARLYQEKEQLASRDGLTGVENHRTFQERFQTEILRAQRYEHKLAVMMMDIDFFKKVNDNYGHPVGDIVLKEVAKIIGQNIRAGTDLMARYGGEEFVLMLADTDKERAGETAERIRESIAAKVFESGATRFQVTMSIGAAIYPTDSKHGPELLEKADKALYRAKETGRNRLIFYN